MWQFIRIGAALSLVAGVAFWIPAAHADRGVGVNLGSIVIDDKLVPGGSYNLPILGVINTGDEPGDYEVVVSHLQDQREMRPPDNWFDFQPQRFFLEAGQVQQVRIRLIVPTGADPGDYFAFLEAHPIAEGEGVRIGVAAATKLSFTVKPSNWLEAQRVRMNRFIDDNSPWSYIIPAAILALIMLYALRRLFRIRLQVQRR